MKVRDTVSENCVVTFCEWGRLIGKGHEKLRITLEKHAEYWS